MTWSSLPVLAGFSSNLLIFCCSWHLKWFLSKFELPALIWVCTDDISKKLHALHFSFHTLLIISTSSPRMLRVELIFCHPNSIVHKYLGGYYLFKNRRRDEVPLNYEFLCQLASSEPCSVNNSKLYNVRSFFWMFSSNQFVMFLCPVCLLSTQPEVDWSPSLTFTSVLFQSLDLCDRTFRRYFWSTDY